MSQVRPCPVRGCSGQPTPSTMCDTCFDRMDAAMVQLQVAYRALRSVENLVPGSTSGEKITGTTGEGIAPLRIGYLALADTIAETLTAWEDRIRHHAALKPRIVRGVRQEWSVDRAVTFLTRWLLRIRDEPDFGPAMADELIRLRAVTHRTLGWNHLAHRLPAPCPSCDLLTLVRHNGDDVVICSACPARWSEAEYEHLVRVLAEDYRDRTGAA